MGTGKPQRKTTPGLQFLRAWRIAEVVILLGNLTIGIWNAVHGHVFSVISFVTVIGLGALIAWQNRVIRRRLAQLNPPPRPDYAAIARMERPIWGKAFEHAGGRRQCPAMKPDGLCCVRDRHEDGRHEDGRGDTWPDL